MTNHHEMLAKQVVEQFTETLDDSVRTRITAAQLDDLEQAIRKLLSHERAHIAELMEGFARTLRSGVDTPELEL
jgi:hypothetical protein